MKSREIAFGAAAFTATVLTGCAQDVTYNSIDQCNGKGTNVEPTYVSSEPGYNPDKDPTVLEAVQVKAIEAGTSRYDDHGIGTLVCKVGVGEGNWFNNQPAAWRQVLTHRAVEIANSAKGEKAQ